MLPFLSFSLPALPLAIAGIRDSQTQINGLLMLQCTGWAAWAVLIMADDDAANSARGRGWLVAFLAVKGLAGTLLFTVAQATALDRELLQNALYVGTAALAYGLWGQFLVQRWPGERPPQVLRAAGWAGLAAWLALGAWRGPPAAWMAWPWLVVAPVIAGAGWIAWRERRFAFAALGAALLIEFSSPHTVLAWYAGFVTELSLPWTQLAALAPGAARHAAGNGLLVVPVSPAALAWFAATTVAVWSGFIAWQIQRGVRRGRLWAMPLAALALTTAGFAIYGLSLAVAFRSMSRETSSRLDTLATVAPWDTDTTGQRRAPWRRLRELNAELGIVFRWELTRDGRRQILDPIPGGATALPVLPIERAAIARGQPYGLGPFQHASGISFFSTVPAGHGPDGTPRWLAVIGPIERFYLYKRPSALLGNTVIFLFGLVGLVALGYRLHRERGQRQRLARERAEEAARMKTAFLAKVSHELRTPLQSLLGYGELLAPHVPGETGRAHLAAQRTHGGLMLRLVNDLLDLSAMDAGQFRLVEKPAPLAALVRDTIETLRPRAATKALDLHHTVASDVPAWVVTDTERFRQIILNLVGNAVKFTAAGRIDVAVTVVARGPDAACTLELAVADTGPGIAPADQARLFQPFSRLELAAAHEGAGLGLALSAALCRQLGGGLTVESDGRSGACFRARLVVRSCSEPPPETSPAGPADLRGQRVLVADDNTLIRQLFGAHLSALGAVCEFATDGEEALRLTLVGDFDALILDLAMPRLDGLTVARQVRAAGRSALRIVGVSAHAASAVATEAQAAGMDAFLPKPVELAALSAALGASSPAPPVSDTHTRLQVQLAQLFRTEAATQRAAIADALATHDWPAVKARAHYLKNSATVVRDDRLYAACEALEDAADARDAPGGEAAWRACGLALAPWLK